jgi:ornithine cyclodeaminase/mu-crystallin family protein
MKMGADAIWITEAEVVRLMDLKDAIVALEAALREEARGEAHNMTKTLLQYGKNNLHAIGGKLGNLVGTKTWTHTQGGTCPLLLLWSAEDGSLVAVIEAFALGNLRTGGISGVAASWMAREDASVMAIVGAGKQALAQVGAMLAVRPIERLRIHSPREDSRIAFAAKARAEFGIVTEVCASVNDACKGAQIVGGAAFPHCRHARTRRPPECRGRDRAGPGGIRAGRLCARHAGGRGQSSRRAAALARIHDSIRFVGLGGSDAALRAHRLRPQAHRA